MAVNGKQMLLPDPAAELWRTVRTALDDALKPLLPEGTVWQIGGGTILGARWRHRRSTDIDLKVPSGTGVRGLQRHYGSRFEELMEALGADEIRYRSGQVTVTFGNRRLDIFEGEPLLPGGTLNVEIDGRTEHVQKTQQILVGKVVGRGVSAPVRDLFDIGVAALRDPRALEVAINCVQDQTFREMLSQWEGADGFYRREAADRLKGVAEEYRFIADQPASEAAAAAQKARYKEVTVDRTPKGIIVETRTGAGNRSKEYQTGTAEDIANRLYEDGIISHVSGTERLPEAMVKNIIGDLINGEKERLYDTETGLRGPQQWMSARGSAGTTDKAHPVRRPDVKDIMPEAQDRTPNRGGRGKGAPR